VTEVSTKGDRLHDHHHISSPLVVQSKKELARDIWLIFTDTMKVKFVLKDNRVEMPSRHWCNICK